MGDTTAGPLESPGPVGWFVVGPMEAVCLADARTADVARAYFAGRYIAAVEPVPAGNPRFHGLTCRHCGEVLDRDTPTTEECD